MQSYKAYGLGIRSELNLPELLSSDSGDDIYIHLGNIDLPPANPEQKGNCVKASPQEAILFWEQIGALHIRNGNEIIADPLPNLDESVLRLFILGAGLAVLIHQRNFQSLHASAVSIDGYAVAFLGMSGWGKSTMAAALLARGHRLVADDIVAIKTQDTESPLVYGGFPQMKIWPEVAATLDSIPADLPMLHPKIKKRALRIPQGFQQAPIPLGCVYVLGAGESVEPEIALLKPQAALIEFVRHSYVARLLERTGSMKRHFQQSSEIVNHIPVCSLTRRKSLADLPDLARMVEADALERIAHLDG